MKLSRESEYGLEGLIFLAKQPPGTVMLVSDIAAKQGFPKSFLAKIFQKLAQHGIVRSFRGAIRGYALARPQKEISLKEVVGAIEGSDIFDRCIFWSDRCADKNPCFLHGQWEEINHQLIENLMEQTTLEDLVERKLQPGKIRPFLAARGRKR